MNDKEYNYVPGTQSFSAGFLGPRGDVGYKMVYNSSLAKAIIDTLIVDKREIDRVDAGLDGDWGENHCTIYDKEGFQDYGCWRDSIWAEPIIIVYFNDGPSEKFSVWEKEPKD